MWIMLIKSIPVDPAIRPPRMSLHWSTPWPMVLEERPKAKKRSRTGDELFGDPDEMWGCKSPDVETARRITFNGQDLRVWDYEFSEPAQSSLREYIVGDDDHAPTHTLMPGDVAGDTLIDAVLNGTQRDIYEAALLDGCNHDQAMLTALGQDITDPDAAFPAIGWYKVKDEYGLIFCSEDELSYQQPQAEEMVEV